MLRATAIFVAITAGAAGLSGCGQGSGMTPAQRSHVASLEQRVVALETEVATLREATGRIDALEQANETITGTFAPTTTSPALILDLTNSSFTTGWTGLGGFTMSVQNMQPYAGATRLNLEFVNLAAATLNTPKLKISYGFRKGEAPGEILVLEVDSLQNFMPGRYTNQLVTIPNVLPEELIFISVTLQPNRISALGG